MLFTEFLFSDLENATKKFSTEIISTNTGESSNVYKGNFQNLGSVAVKKFKTTTAWPDPCNFAEEAKRVGELKHKSLVNLIGCCSSGDERFLVAEFLPNDTLATRLFNDNNHAMEWSMRLRVACCIAEALDYCSTAGFTSYNNLSADSVLFDEGGDARLSCFGLMKESEDGQRTLVPESVTYKFGCVLLNLLTGKQFLPNLVSEDHEALMDGGQQNVTEFLDPKLEGKFPTEDAISVFRLAAQCMEQDSRHIPTSELLQLAKQHQRQGPPKKPANKVAGARRPSPHGRHKKKTFPDDEEIEAQKEAKVKEWKIKKAEKTAKMEEKPKAKKTKPVQATPNYRKTG